MIRQIISRKLPTGFKLPTLVVAIFATFMAPLEANINVPPDAALEIDGGHVVVNDDDTNKNGIWDKSEVGSVEVPMKNIGLEGPKTKPAKPEPVLKMFSFKPTWSGSPGKLVITQSNSSTPPTPSTPPLPDPNIKLWKDPEKKEQFTLAASYDVTADSREPVTFWVEGIEPTESFDTIKFTAVYTVTKPTSKLSATATGTIAFGVTQADLDIDSDNQNGTEATGYDDTEDKIEFSFKEEHPGKILLETRNDVDSDGVIDSVDGIEGLTGTSGTPKVAGLKLIPMRLTLKKPFNTTNAKVKFSYRASVPRIGEGIEANGQDAAGNNLYRISTPGIRLWTKDGDERTSGKDVGGTDGGDFIPADTEINWKDLFEQDSEESTEKIIYVEYVDVEGSDKQFSKEDIVVEISDDTSSAKGYIQYNGGEKKHLLGTKSPDGVNVALLPVEFVPDWNRDGMINDDDAGKASDENPFIFWINDDDDENPEHEFADIPQSGQDGLDNVVNGARDLVDFFPIQLRIQKLLEVFSPDEYTYKISHPTGALHFIEMPTVQPNSQRINGAGSYLADEAKAAEAMSHPMKDTAGGGSELSREYLDAVKKGMGVLLFESGSATNQSFELVLFKKSNNSKMARIPSEKWMNLVPVQDMFWQVNIRGAIEPNNNIPPAIQEAQNERFRETRKNRWFVFCHGYNVDEKRARGWNAEVFKRLHQMGSDSKFLGVTWEGNQGQIGGILGLFVTVTPDYWHNAYNAFKSSAALSAVVNSQSGKKVIAGHSLGNMLVSSAICDHGLNAEQYFLLNAAVAREAYSAAHVNSDRNLVRHPNWANHATRLWSTDYWTLFSANDGRRKLTWQGRFSNLAANTSPHNYYSSSEDVLKSGDGTKPNLFTDVTIRSQLAWVKQEMGKGEFTKKLVTGVHQDNGGWAFNSFWNGNTPPPAQNELLKADPYFKPFTEFFDQNGQNPQSIHGPIGSAIAGQYPIRSFLLGHDVPAISNPAGSNRIDDDGIGNTDMPDSLKAGTWGDWQHSDLKKEPMGRVWKLFSDMVSRGDLNSHFIPPPTN